MLGTKKKRHSVLRCKQQYCAFLFASGLGIHQLESVFKLSTFCVSKTAGREMQQRTTDNGQVSSDQIVFVFYQMINIILLLLFYFNRLIKVK